MKKILLIIFFGITIHHSSLLAAPVATSTIEPTSQWENQFKLSDFIKLDTKDFQKITRKKMNLLEKIAFKMTQNKMKRYLKKHNDVSVADYIKAEETEKKKLSFLWFMLGLLGPALGVVLAAFSWSVVPFILLAIAPIAVVYSTKTSKSEKGSMWTGWIIVIAIILLLGAIASGGYVL